MRTARRGWRRTERPGERSTATPGRDVEFTIEQHWVSDTTVLAAWHASFNRRSTGRIVRLAGFLTAEVAPDGRVSRFREWTRSAPDSGG